ncbi:hypothetical protein NW768_004213 [Fusarium equiseti]|uniref:Uncharacterized protein n=1 Tax=Fusarium equiseti TaxID=61235 RepID=A0ABQ8RJT9_FUSEQ|nr:hypothetical protein NW768_004213 [Fusarium equiseti]
MLPESAHSADEGRDPPQEVSGEATMEHKPTTAAIEDAGSLPPASEMSPTPLREEWISRSFGLDCIPLHWTRMPSLLVQPLQLLTAPQVLVTVYVFGLTIGWTVITSVLISLIYASPPLLWKARSIGLLNLSSLLGLLVGLPFGGYFADLLFLRSAHMNISGPDPRSRLPMVLLGALISPTGCLVLGHALRRADSWIQVCVGWSLLAFGLTGSANILLTYSVNSMPSRAGDIGVLVNVMKNCLAFGVSYASDPWMQAMGVFKQFAIMSALLWLGYLLVIPIWFWSQAIVRKSTAYTH